jgi:proton-coupled amino acid transporter
VALLADAFILIDLAYIFYNGIATISRGGLEPTIKLFNPETFTLTIGSSLFTLEGIGLVLPI